MNEAKVFVATIEITRFVYDTPYWVNPNASLDLALHIY